jgi:hypothetical protein
MSFCEPQNEFTILVGGHLEGGFAVAYLYWIERKRAIGFAFLAFLSGLNKLLKRVDIEAF